MQGPHTLSAAGPRQDTDADLLAAARARNAQAFAQLVSRHYAAVYRVVWRMMSGHPDAQDVTQEAFLRLWNNPDQLREAGALKGWLMRVASNLVMDRFRQRSMADLDDALDVQDTARLPDAALGEDWASRRIDAALAMLPARQRMAMTLVHFEQVSNIAAAAAMDVSVDALESLLARARRALKSLLAADKDLLLQSLTTENG